MPPAVTSVLGFEGSAGSRRRRPHLTEYKNVGWREGLATNFQSRRMDDRKAARPLTSLSAQVCQCVHSANVRIVSLMAFQSLEFRLKQDIWKKENRKKKNEVLFSDRFSRKKKRALVKC